MTKAYGICSVSVSPIRNEPSDRAEMVSQLLFFEKFEVLKKNEKWFYIKSDFDSYQGWIDSKHCLVLNFDLWNSIEYSTFCSDVFNLALENDEPFTLTIGTALPKLNENQSIDFHSSFRYIGNSIESLDSKNQLIQVAKTYLNVPYLWGGKSSFGIDCSGFVQQVYRMFGKDLPRDAYQQAEMGEVLNFTTEAEIGDLAFFHNDEGKIIHVGIVVENQKIIHAHGKVRIDPFDSTGIFNTDSQSYSHRLRFVRRLIC